MAFEINGLAAANVAEITNVPKASIVEIYGVETGYVTYPAIARTNTEVMAYRAITGYDKHQDLVLVGYQRTSDNHFMIKIGSINNDGDITFGNEIEIDDGDVAQGCKPLDMYYNEDDEKMYFLYLEYDTAANNNYRTCIKNADVNTDKTLSNLSSRHQFTGTAFYQANMFYDTVIDEVCAHYDQPGQDELRIRRFYGDGSGNITDSARTAHITGTSDNEHSGVTWCNQHGETNSKNIIVTAYKRDNIGRCRAGVSNSDATINWGDEHNLTGESGFENYQVAYDEKIGKGIIVSLGTATGVTSAGYFWVFTLDGDDDHDIEPFPTGHNGGYVTSATDNHYGINVIYNPHGGHINIIYETEYDIRMKTATLNTSDNTVSLSSEITIYNGDSTTEAAAPATAYGPDRLALTYMPDTAAPRILIGYRRETSGYANEPVWVAAISDQDNYTAT